MSQEHYLVMYNTWRNMSQEHRLVMYNTWRNMSQEDDSEKKHLVCNLQHFTEIDIYILYHHTVLYTH